MKTKMKSAFAFIAVALMIMVAVVPMVGVFTEDSSAAVTVVPEVPSDKTITISGKVANAANGSIADVLVKVEGDGVSEYVLTTASGYSATVYSLGKDLTVSVVVDENKYAKITGKTTANPVLGYTFSEQKLMKVSASVKDVDFKAGYVAVSGNLEYKNVTEKYMTPVSVSYKVGEVTGPTSVTSVEGTYSILVPAGSKDVTIHAEGFTDVKITDVGTAAQTSKTLKHATLNFRTITINEGDIAKDVISGNTLSITPVDGSRVVPTSTTVSIEDKKVRVEYTLADETETQKNTNVKVSDSLGFGKEITGDITSVASYTYNAYVTGEIKASSVPVYTNNVSIKFYKDDGTTEVTDATTTATIVDNKYYAPLGKITSADAKKIMASFETNDLVKGSSTATSISTSGKTTANITVASDLVNKFSLITVTIAGTSGITIEVSGEARTIGEKDGKIVTTGATQTFYAETGKNILIKPTSGVFDVESREFVVSGATTVVFNINTKEYTNADHPVKDAAGNALKDVEVFYKIGETGAYNATAIKTDKDGKFKITVNSNVSANDVLLYLKDTKYTFNSNKDKPFALSSVNDEGDWKAKEQPLTFYVKDAANEVIADLSGLALQFAKYKIHAVGAGVNAFDMIGTASDVTYDATTKKFSFIAELIPVSTEDYRVAYGISVKSNTTDYTFDAITEYKVGLTVEAKEQTFTGTITDAATGVDAKKLKGMTVAIYDSTDKTTKLSKDVTTLNDGSFSVISKSGTLKVVDPNGVYTFDVGAPVDGVYTIKANEKTYEGTVTDADNVSVKNAKITVKVVDADGKTIGSVATATDKDGKYSIITNLAVAKKIIATDADGKRTFKDVVISTTVSEMPVVKSGQYTLSGTVTVKDMAINNAIKDITVTLSTYSATVDPVLVSTAVTDKDGKYSFFVNEKAGYGVVATSSGNYIFSEEETTFTGFVANIETEYAIFTGTVKESVGEKALSGIKVTAYDGTKVFGEYTTDKIGEFKYPNITGMKFKAVDPNGAYTFADEFTTNEIKAKEKTVTVTIKADDSSSDKLPLAGVTVNFLKGEKVVKTATTDAKGNASVIIALSAFDKIKAVDGNTAYGAMTFATELTTVGGTIEADQTVYSGFYANGDVVNGVVVTYEMSKGDAYVEKGKAVVIDNKYYIASAATAVDKIVITANAQGFYAVNTFNSLATIGASDLKIKEKPGIVKVDEDDVLFGEFYTVYNATNAQVGDKIILRASEVAYKPLEDGNETTVVKYKFDGWYVNGVKVSDDLEYVYTVTEDCLVYADYKVSTYGTVSDDNGISPSVLVIGIAAVIVALIAVVYTVIQKKE